MCPAARPRAPRCPSLDGMAHGALGTDTGGSCRIPAAYNGIVGYKPTQRRVPLDGGVPLSFSLDSFGPLARTVGCCAMLDAVLADEPIIPLQPRPVKGMRLAVPTTVVLDDLDDAVARTFERALESLSRHGALIERIEVPEFLDVGADERQGRLRRGGKLCLASLSRSRARATSTIPASPAAHHARREPERRRLYRFARRAALADRAHRGARSRPMMRWCCRPPPTRRRSIADLADDKAFTSANLRRCAIAR